MSQPRSDYSSPLQGALLEIISAMSALNMEPDPKTPEELANTPPSVDYPGGGIYFLSVSDHWAEHAMEHLHAAMKCLRQLDAQRP